MIMNIMPKIAKRKTTGNPVVITTLHGNIHIIDCVNLEEAKLILKKENKKYNGRAKHEALTSLGLTKVKVNGKTFYE